MSQDFKLRYDEMRENAPSENSGQDENMYETFSSQNQVRNICFVLADGNQQFINYAYLISGKFLVEENKIILEFSANLVTLSGERLSGLFTQLMMHLPKKICCVDHRYNSVAETNGFIINQIEIK